MPQVRHGESALWRTGIESALSALNTYVKRQVLDRRLTQTPYNRLAADGVAFCSRPSIESDAMTQSHLLKDCARNQRKLPVLFPSAVAGTPCQSVRAVASLFRNGSNSIAARSRCAPIRLRRGTRELVSRVPAFKSSNQGCAGGRRVGCGLGVGVCLGVTVGVGDGGG